MAKKTLVEQTKKHSIIDGSGVSVMVGAGEQYVVPYAIALGATAPQAGMLATIPSFLGSLSQLAGLRLLGKWQRRKRLVLASVLAQTISIAPLFILPFLTRSVPLLILLFSIYYVTSNIGGPAWNSWIGEIIPQEERASYFARRNKYTTAALFATILGAGLILQSTQTNLFLGFGILFTIALAGRTLSYYHLTRQHEPHNHQPRITIPFRQFVKRMRWEAFGSFVIFRSAMSLAIMVAAPFFAVYMLRNLHFDYVHYMIVILTPMVAKIISAKAWAHYAQKYGNRTIMQTSAALVALIPLGWLMAGLFFANTPFVFYAILIAETISGIGWAGFELTTFNYMLETTTPALRATFFAYFNVIFGLAVLTGGMIGVALSALLQANSQTLLVIFLCSFVLRLFVASVMITRVPQVAIHPKVSQGRLFYELLIQRPLGFASAPLGRLSILQGRAGTLNKQSRQTIKRHEGTYSRDQTLK